MENFKQSIVELINKKCTNEELEIRFGFIPKMNPQISLKVFEESINFLNTFAKFEKIENHTIEYFSNIKKYTSGKDTFFIEKKNIKNIDITEYDLRVSYNKETHSTERSDVVTEPHSLRINNRKRFVYTFNGLQFDVSMNTIKQSNNVQSEIYYDLEIEIKEQKNIDFIYDIIYQFLKIYQNSDFILKNSDKEKILKSYSNITFSKKFIGCQPATISIDKIKKNEEYALTLKLNGKRAFLMNLGNYFYEISSKMDIKYTGVKCENLKEITILDTEYFKGIYHVFDILFLEGNDVREQKFKTRYNLLQEFISKIKNKKIIQKYYQEGNVYENSIKYYKQYFSKVNDNLDGMIYIPVNGTYNSVQLKWKPENYNTIDFKIKKFDKLKWKLLCFGKNDTEIVFSSPEYKNIGICEVTEEQEDLYVDESVIEFIFSKEEEKFIPIKIRYDKLKGNYIDVAKDNFKSILTPFNFENFKEEPQEVLNGRRFNNYIKRKLLKENSKNVYTLLDLACGKGGDMFKWVDSNITFVKGYDNDNVSIKEAINRYNTNIKDENTTKNYHFSFQYTDLANEQIVPNLQDFIQTYNGTYNSYNKFDIATCFFAIHYFFKEEKTLNNFIQNIKNNLKKNGLFIMTTFDDTLLKNEDYNINTPLLKVSKSWETDENWESQIYNKAINVWIKDTVLNTSREEYIVDFKFLTKKMEQEGFTLIKSGLFQDFYDDWKSKRNNLNDIEKMMCFLNRYAIFSYTGTSNKKYTERSEVVTGQREVVTGQREVIPKVYQFEEFTEQSDVVEQLLDTEQRVVEEESDTERSVVDVVEEQQITYSQTDLQKKKIIELKSLCKNLELSQTGKKELLIKRILQKQNTQN
jgi:mRNA (guanine-N7-)-methyltransferase